MSRPTRSFPLLALACALAFWVTACSERPQPASIDNPYDPAAGAGDLFDVEVSFEKGAVLVKWNAVHVNDPLAVSYIVERSDSPMGIYGLAGEVRIEDGIAPDQLTQYSDEEYVRDAFNFYRVRLARDDGVTSDQLVQPAGIRTAPTVELASGLSTTGTRLAVLDLLPKTEAGEDFELSLDPNFSTFTSYDAAEVADDVVFDLGPASRGQMFRLYSRVRRAGAVDTTGVDSLFADLAVRMVAQLNSAQLVEDTLLTVDVSDLEGVTRMRFARSATELASAPWEAPSADPFSVMVSLDPSDFLVEVHGEFESDFGFTETGRLDLETHRLVGPVDFRFVLSDSTTVTVDTVPEGTGVSVVTGVAQGVTMMRFSESLDFSGVPWDPFGPIQAISLSPGIGVKTVYGQFRNVFSNVFAAQATITVVSAGP